MKKILAVLILQFFVLITVIGQERLNADTAKTRILWTAEKVTGEHHGTINLKSGWLDWKDNQIVAGEFHIDMNTIKESEGNAKFEGHMRSDDFFSVEKFPVSTLIINRSTPFDKGTGTLTGTLTIKGITNPIEFKAANQTKDDGMWFYANISVDRTKYDIRWGSGTFFDNLGDKTVFDEFKLKVNLFVKK
jgi:polyisoprenoid-binding protein YceI